MYMYNISVSKTGPRISANIKRNSSRKFLIAWTLGNLSTRNLSFKTSEIDRDKTQHHSKRIRPKLIRSEATRAKTSPSVWKESIGIIIPKRSKPDNSIPKAYRPIVANSDIGDVRGPWIGDYEQCGRAHWAMHHKNFFMDHPRFSENSIISSVVVGIFLQMLCNCSTIIQIVKLNFQVSEPFSKSSLEQKVHCVRHLICRATLNLSYSLCGELSRS